MDKQLIDQICTCTTLSEVARLASPDIYRRTRWETTLSVQGLGIQSVAMTVYRTGAIQRNANNEICFSDSNVALMLFLAYMLKGNASFFLELRARGNTLSNLQFMELLRNCGAKVHVVPNSRFFKHKVHAKVLMARFWDNKCGWSECSILYRYSGFHWQLGEGCSGWLLRFRLNSSRHLQGGARRV